MAEGWSLGKGGTIDRAVAGDSSEVAAGPPGRAGARAKAPNNLAPPNWGHIGAGRSLCAREGGYSSGFGCLSPAQGQQVLPGWQEGTGLILGGGRQETLGRGLEAAG